MIKERIALLVPLSQATEMPAVVHGQTLTQFPIIEVQNNNLAIFLVFTKNKIKQQDKTLLTLMIGGLLVVYP